MGDDVEGVAAGDSMVMAPWRRSDTELREAAREALVFLWRQLETLLVAQSWPRDRTYPVSECVDQIRNLTQVLGPLSVKDMPPALVAVGWFDKINADLGIDADETASPTQDADLSGQVEVTVRVGMRIRVPDGTNHREVEKACLVYAHGTPGYVAATAEALREDPAGSVVPYPLLGSDETMEDGR